MQYTRGQSAIELILVLSGLMVVLSLIYLAGSHQITQSQNVLRISQARTTVTDLVSAAEDVYSDGAGARRHVYIVIPDGVDPGRTKIYNGTVINIGVQVENGTTDVNAKSRVRLVEGVDFPKSPGGYWIWVRAYEGHVVIGELGWDIEPQTIAVDLYPASNTSVSLELSNNVNISNSVSLNLVWVHSAATATINGSSSQTIVLAAHGQPGASKTTYLNFTTIPAAPLGTYTGYITANGSDGESILLNVMARIVGHSSGNVTPASNISYVLIDTFRDPAYTIPAATFDPTETVDITAMNYTPNSIATIRIYGPTMALVHQNTEATNSTGGFVYYWNPSMPLLTGEYNVTINDSVRTGSWRFNITGCP